MPEETIQSIVERVELLINLVETCKRQQAILERLFRVQSEIARVASDKLWLLQHSDDFDERSILIVLELILRLTNKLNRLERQREILMERRARLNVEIERYRRQLGDTNSNQ